MAVESGVRKASEPPPGRGAVSRRVVLGGAVAGGAAVAAIRLLGLNPATVASAPAQSISGATDWASPLGKESAKVMQLLRRATFGAGSDDLERALADGYRRTVDRLLETPAVRPPDLPGADSAGRANPIRPAQLQKWWLDHMLTTPTPFAERMTLFWHGHFTSDYRKVGLRSPYVYWQNQTWRANALGDFRGFLYQVTVDPAMLRYLDLGTSTGDAPNENYARELMELFSMGAGTFTEEDVRSAAKGLAGWREPAPGSAAKVGAFVPRRAYRGAAFSFLGRTATFDTKGILDQIFTQAATAPHVVRRVLVNFALPNPSGATVDRLAAAFVRSGWSIRQLMSDVFTSDEFVAGSAYRSLVKQPVEFMVHAMRAVGGAAQSAAALRSASGMGQVLFDPPDVGGWPLNEGWVSSNTVLARVNFISSLLQGIPSLPASAHAHADHLDGVLSSATAALISSAGTDLERWTAVLASPEFQLK
jgi:uncharacterized protein (DUF1800 family)